MGLLDGDLQDVFGSVFGSLMLDGTLTKAPSVSDGKGGWTAGTPQTAAVKLMIESYSEFYRAQAGIPDTDVKIIVLQKDVAFTPDTDSRITVRGEEYSVVQVQQDPAQASWTLQGRPVSAAD
ncbi:hypothetical protein [Euryhalocaulis caribicus]|uniref:hypothetical protein n=1 Tax=Euryhalocaulis caribicus TaxID=1161401 RepID=UPI00039A5260|nr:hypothetical protein [Euryhalocaulis caribicus]